MRCRGRSRASGRTVERLHRYLSIYHPSTSIDERRRPCATARPAAATAATTAASRRRVGGGVRPRRRLRQSRLTSSGASSTTVDGMPAPAELDPSGGQAPTRRVGLAVSPRCGGCSSSSSRCTSATHGRRAGRGRRSPTSSACRSRPSTRSTGGADVRALQRQAASEAVHDGIAEARRLGATAVGPEHLLVGVADARRHRIARSGRAGFPDAPLRADERRARRGPPTAPQRRAIPRPKRSRRSASRCRRCGRRSRRRSGRTR